MEDSNVPVFEIATEYRAEARAYRRSLALVVFAVGVFGALYLIPHAELRKAEGEFVSAEGKLSTQLAESEAQLAAFEEARSLLGGYRAGLEARALELSEVAKQKVRDLNGMLAMVADPATIEGVVAEANMAVQAQPSQLKQEEILEGLTAELHSTYGLDEEGIRILSEPGGDGPEWRRVADRVLGHVMDSAKGELREFARLRHWPWRRQRARLNRPFRGTSFGRRIWPRPLSSPMTPLRR